MKIPFWLEKITERPELIRPGDSAGIFLENELSESDDPVYLQNSKYTLRRKFAFK